MVLYEKIPQAFPYMVCPDGALMIVSRTATRRPAALEPYKKTLRTAPDPFFRIKTDMLLLLQDKLYDSQRFHIPARRIVNRAPDKEAAPSDYFKITFRKFFFPFFRTSPSPESFSFPNTAWMSDTFSPSTATPPCCTARLASDRDGTRPLL